jgi:hypothetical protein
MRRLRRVVELLGRPWARHAVIAIALILALPSLLSPFFIDEHVQALKWKEYDAGRSTLARVLGDYFVFSDQALNREEMEHGLGAWWTAPDLKVAFWRPLSALTHAIDHFLWPENTVLMHGHTLLWFLALLLALGALYRRFLAPGVASLALALYAWDDARGMLFSWIANRHALVAGFFGVCTVLLHDKWRRDGWRPGAWLAPVFLAAGLLSGEMAVATVGFLLAHALVLDQGRLGRRVVRLLPYVIVTVGWQAVYSAAGYGAQASGAYTNPLREPLTYLAKLVERAPIFSLAQLTPLMGDLWGAYPRPAKVAIYALAIVVLAATARIAWPRLRPERQSCFWLIGAGLALAFICATGPQDRNLVFVGFGVAPALAMLFASMAQLPAPPGWSRFLVAALAVFNLAMAPALLPAKCLTILGINSMFEPANASIPRNPEITGKTLVVVWTGLEPALYYSWSLRDHQGIPRPGKTRILATSMGDVSVSRPDERTLRLHPNDGFFASEASRVLRSSSRPFREGDVVQLSNMRATVTEVTRDGRPATVDFHFSAPLESPEWLWMRGDGRRLVVWAPPKVGQTIVVAALR